MPLILHVEDENVVRILYKEVFEDYGYEIVQASSGEEALRLLRHVAPDLIILDLKMPGMGGRGFLQEFRLLNLRIPVVISSAYPYPENAPQNSSIDAYVVKSGDLKELVRTVRGILSGDSRNPKGRGPR
ncbi:MAG: response regulator [Deltaproteobacteria bacterium]|nr:response regulator [Deltaproteobacteria bacterium]